MREDWEEECGNLPGWLSSGKRNPFRCFVIMVVDIQSWVLPRVSTAHPCYGLTFEPGVFTHGQVYKQSLHWLKKLLGNEVIHHAHTHISSSVLPMFVFPTVAETSVAVLISMALCILILLGILAWCGYRNRRTSYQPLPGTDIETWGLALYIPAGNTGI